MPTGNSYRILEHLAKRRNLKIKQIPADGNCFFHAVSAFLTSVGEQNIDGSDIPQKLIDYFETVYTSHLYMTIVIGDFNVDLLDSPSHEILTPMNKSGFDQLVPKLPPTMEAR
ncbi:Hypothetical predicted protein [Octopus vulgaris]|uniref:OTU domain-containing protein n=1 Tax=Octopus vulgaris TaxID=6645 RepID=A0AA36B7C8_OCTVU|nr:Hypothetical predicted protein [Octopus vulgaris]